MNKRRNKDGGIVYSTNPDYNYQDEFEEAETLPPEKQRLYLRREVRNGKPAIVIKEFVGNSDDLRALEKLLKTKLGLGGSCKDGEILIQGDVRDKVKNELEKIGYKTKG